MNLIISVVIQIDYNYKQLQKNKKQIFLEFIVNYQQHYS